MKTIKIILNFLFTGIKKFYAWTKKHTKYYIGIMALICWSIFYAFGHTFGIESYPIGYFQKIFFGILAMSVIEGVGFFWLKHTQPYYFDLLNNETEGGINELNAWQKIVIGLFWYGLYVGGIVLLASLY